MELLDCEDFLQELTKIVTEDPKDASKSLWITYKRYIPNTRTWKRKKTPESVSDENAVCLIRVRIGNRKLSTHVQNTFSENFTNALNQISESTEEQP